MHRLLIAVSACLLLIEAASGATQSETSKPTNSSAVGRLDPRGISGSLVICGGGKLPPEIVAQFLELAGGHNDGFIFMREAWVRVLGDFLDKQLEAACVR